MSSIENHRILVVDDAIEVAVFFTRALERGDFAVSYATDGKEGLKLYAQARDEGQPFTLLILDWAMPSMTGLEVARTLRDQGDNVKIVFLTAYYENVTPDKPAEVGAEVWGKPIELEDLTCNVRRILEIA